jgi:D-alanyl-D-alanine carboxypeptidase
MVATRVPGPARRRSALTVVALACLLVASVASSPSIVAAAGPHRAPLPACTYTDVATRYSTYRDWRRTLLDTIERVGRHYVPPHLVSTSRAHIAGGAKVRALMIDDLRAMAAAARRAGKGIAVRSAYRSWAEQKAVFASWVRRSGYRKALLGSARPGHSEHQLGLAVDFRSASSLAAPWDYPDWAATPPGAWMKRHAWQYGFIMSYPHGKTSLTCYMYEPWHYRYVGRAEAAAVHDSGFVLRQYLWLHFESAPRGS